MDEENTLIDNFKSGVVWTADRLLEEANAPLMARYNERIRRSSRTSDEIKAEEEAEEEEEEEEPHEEEEADEEGVEYEEQYLEVSRAIHQTARKVPVYTQSALHLVRECNILVNTYTSWANLEDPPVEAKQTAANVSIVGMRYLTILVAKRVLVKDLNRILTLLQDISSQLLADTRDDPAIEELILYGLNYLLLPRVSGARNEKEVAASRARLEVTVNYDRASFKAQVGASPPSPDPFEDFIRNLKPIHARKKSTGSDADVGIDEHRLGV